MLFKIYESPGLFRKQLLVLKCLPDVDAVGCSIVLYHENLHAIVTHQSEQTCHYVVFISMSHSRPRLHGGHGNNGLC